MNELTVKQGVLIEEVLRLLNQRWISPNDVEGIPEKMGIGSNDDIGIKIFVLNQILETYKKIPERYFKETEHRENILEASQEALDDLIEQEQEEEEEFDDDDDDFDI